jgi:hypothetical protein
MHRILKVEVRRQRAKITAAAEARQLSHNSLLAYRRTWLKIIAWAAAEGFVLETFPVERVGEFS